MRKAFKNVKDLFREAVVIAHPKAGTETFLRTDTSTGTIAIQLYQHNKDGYLQVIGFTSQTLKKYEKSYSICELQLLAIVQGLKNVDYLWSEHRSQSSLTVDP